MQKKYTARISLTVLFQNRDRATRTPDILLPKQARYQLRYIPYCSKYHSKKIKVCEALNCIIQDFFAVFAYSTERA